MLRIIRTNLIQLVVHTYIQCNNVFHHLHECLFFYPWVYSLTINISLSLSGLMWLGPTHSGILVPSHLITWPRSLARSPFISLRALSDSGQLLGGGRGGERLTLSIIPPLHYTSAFSSIFLSVAKRRRGRGVLNRLHDTWAIFQR